MKKLLCLFLIAGFLSANGQYNDLIVKTTLDSIHCKMNSVTGKSSLDGEIKFSIEGQKKGFQYSLDKFEVFYVLRGDSVTPRYFNTSFDYSNSYFLKTGKKPSSDDPYLGVIDKESETSQKVEGWRLDAGNNLKTAGNLMFSSLVFSALGVVLMSVDINLDQSKQLGYVALGAGGLSFLASYVFIIRSGNSIHGR